MNSANMAYNVERMNVLAHSAGVWSLPQKSFTWATCEHWMNSYRKHFKFSILHILESNSRLGAIYCIVDPAKRSQYSVEV
jgi:hypothetical protein